MTGADVRLPIRRVQSLVIGSPWPFRFLMLFTFVLFIAPQAFFTFLIPLSLGKTLAGFALAAYLMERIGQGHPLTVRAPEIRLSFALVGVAVFSIPTSQWPGGSLEVLFDRLLKSIVVFVLLANTITTWRRVRTLFILLVCFGVFLASQGISAFAGGEFMARQTSRIFGYDAPLTANPNDLALTLNLILGLTIGLAFASRGLMSRVLYLGAAMLLALGTVATFSRGGFVGLVILAMVATSRFVTQKVPALVIAIAALGAMTMISPQGYVERLYSIVDTSSDPTGSADARWKLMQSSIELIQENPIFGVGLGMSGVALTKKGHWWTEVHNAYLQVASEIGLGGLLVYLLLIRRLVQSGREAIRRLSATARDRIPVAYVSGFQIALYTFLIQALFHPVAYHFYLFYLAGIGVALHRLTLAPSGMLNNEKPAKTVGTRTGV